MRYNLHTINSTHFKCMVHWIFSKFTELRNHHNLILELFFIIPKNPMPIYGYSIVPPLLTPTNPRQLLIYFLSLYFALLDHPYKWNHIMLTFGSGLIMFLRFIYIIAHISASLLPLSNSIPLQGFITFCLSIHQLMDIWVNSTLG